MYCSRRVVLVSVVSTVVLVVLNSGGTPNWTGHAVPASAGSSASGRLSPGRDGGERTRGQSGGLRQQGAIGDNDASAARGSSTSSGTVPAVGDKEAERQRVIDWVGADEEEEEEVEAARGGDDVGEDGGVDDRESEMSDPDDTEAIRASDADADADATSGNEQRSEEGDDNNDDDDDADENDKDDSAEDAEDEEEGEELAGSDDSEEEGDDDANEEGQQDGTSDGIEAERDAAAGDDDQAPEELRVGEARDNDAKLIEAQQGGGEQVAHGHSNAPQGSSAVGQASSYFTGAAAAAPPTRSADAQSLVDE